MNQIEQLLLELHILEGLLAVLVSAGLGDSKKAEELKARKNAINEKIELLNSLPLEHQGANKSGAFRCP